MSEILKNSEELCSGILETLRSLPYSVGLPKEDADVLAERVEKLQIRLAKARNKVVMKTSQGKQISQQANDRLMGLQNLLKVMMEKERSQPLADVLGAAVKELETSLDRIETYYRSYEAELT